MPARVLVKIVMDGCSDSVVMTLQMMFPVSEQVVGSCVQDAVWRMRVCGVPDRYMRITNGRSAIDAMLEKYTFSDGHGCGYSASPDVHACQNMQSNARKIGESVSGDKVLSLLEKRRREVRYLYSNREEVLKHKASSIGKCHFSLKGIAQLSDKSGICWYSSLFFSLLVPPQLKDFLYDHLQSRSKACPHCGYLEGRLKGIMNDQSLSEEVRRYMYESMHIGDCPDQAPELDGQNGCSMATLLLGMLDVPALTIVSPSLKEVDIKLKNSLGRVCDQPRHPRMDDTCVLFVRSHRSRWRAPYILVHKGMRFVLMSALIGSEFCGHQVAVARSCEPDTWGLSDSDGIRLGMSPIFFKIPRGREWHSVVTKCIPHSNSTSTSNFCDMSPSNRHPLKPIHDQLASQGINIISDSVDVDATKHDLINVDYIYLRM